VRRIAEALYGSYYDVGSLLINDAGGAMPWVYLASQKPPLLAMLYLQATPPRRGCLVVNIFVLLNQRSNPGCVLPSHYSLMIQKAPKHAWVFFNGFESSAA